MANHNLPTQTSTYLNFVTELDARFDDLCFGLDPARSTMTNLPTNSVGWSSAANKWQKWNGTAWVDLTTTYAIGISGNAATATVLATTRTINGVNFNGSANITVNTPTALTFNNAGAGVVSGTTFNGASATTISYNTIGAPSTTGVNASGTWGISITGNAATATSATSATSAGTVTNGFYVVGDQTVDGTKTFNIAPIVGTAAVKTANTSAASTAFVDRMRSLLSGITTGTLTSADRGCLVPATASITAPASVFAAGDVVTIYNNTAAAISIVQGASLLMYQAGTANTGNRNLAQRGVCTLVFISATVAVISGGGLT